MEPILGTRMDASWRRGCHDLAPELLLELIWYTLVVAAEALRDFLSGVSVDIFYEREGTFNDVCRRDRSRIFWGRGRPCFGCNFPSVFLMGTVCSIGATNRVNSLVASSDSISMMTPRSYSVSGLGRGVPSCLDSSFMGGICSCATHSTSSSNRILRTNLKFPTENRKR